MSNPHYYATLILRDDPFTLCDLGRLYRMLNDVIDDDTGGEDEVPDLPVSLWTHPDQNMVMLITSPEDADRELPDLGWTRRL